MQYLKVHRNFWYAKSKFRKEKFQELGYIKQEIWIFPELNRIKPPRFPAEPPTVEEHLSRITPTELYRRFTLDFLLVVGKLFTRIG